MNWLYIKVFVFVILPCFTFSQTKDEIRNSGNYLYGFGVSEIYEKADHEALDDLISQISVSVESKFEYHQIDSNFIYREYAKSVIKTYSSTSLNGANRIEEKKNGFFNVIRYIRKEDLSKMFAKRQRSIIEYVTAGIQAETKFQIADALRNFYWANILLRGHPSYASMSYPYQKDSVLLKIFLPSKINEIFSHITIEILETTYNENDKTGQYTLCFKYCNNPVQSLDYSYKLKNTWTSIINVNNGLAFIEFFSANMKVDDEITIRIEYIFREQSFFDKDVQAMLASDIDMPYFSTCEKRLRLGNGREVDIQQNANIISFKKYDRIEDIDIKIIKTNFEEVVNNLPFKKAAINHDLFTEEGYLAYQKLIEYGDAIPLLRTNEVKIIKINNEIIVRSVPMRFIFSKKRGFTEDVVFIFNEEGKIKDINFSLSQITIDDILSKEDRFATNEEKYIIIHFLENYKTAYCLKRLDFIENVFDEDALIIVGHVVKKYKQADNINYGNLSQEEVTYQKFTKGEYINRLKRLFLLNEFINIHFEDTDVRKAKKDYKVYGIQIAQHYTSDSYADKGYLFLLLDLRDSLNPIIHVRTWQPKKDENGSVYGIEDFPFESY